MGMDEFEVGDLVTADRLDESWPLGLIVYGARPIASGNIGPITPSGGADTGVFRLDNISLRAGRQYLVLTGDLRATLGTVTDRIKWQIRKNDAGVATISSAIICRSEQGDGSGGESANSSAQLYRLLTPSTDSDVVSLLLCLSRPSGAGTITGNANTDDEVIWMGVMDMGPSVSDTGVTLL